MEQSAGTLFIVATPIGNLQDITQRAIQTLQQVDCIAAEDTRNTRHLLQHFAIHTPLLALHDHNESEIHQPLLLRLQQGESIALVSDAGTPLINDPGYRFVCAAHAARIAVSPIPGPCAAIAALSAAGLPTDRFSFEGFLPVQTSARQKRLQSLQHEMRTMIFYEAKHRLLDCLKDMQLVFGSDRHAVLARELTKVHETIISRPLHQIIACVEQNLAQQLGEMVLIVQGVSMNSHVELQQREGERVLMLLAESMPLSQAVRLAVQITGAAKNALYAFANHQSF